MWDEHFESFCHFFLFTSFSQLICGFANEEKQFMTIKYSIVFFFQLFLETDSKSTNVMEYHSNMVETTVINGEILIFEETKRS